MLNFDHLKKLKSTHIFQIDKNCRKFIMKTRLSKILLYQVMQNNAKVDC